MTKELKESTNKEEKPKIPITLSCDEYTAQIKKALMN